MVSLINYRDLNKRKLHLFNVIDQRHYIVNDFLLTGADKAAFFVQVTVAGLLKDCVQAPFFGLGVELKSLVDCRLSYALVSVLRVHKYGRYPKNVFFLLCGTLGNVDGSDPCSAVGDEVILSVFCFGSCADSVNRLYGGRAFVMVFLV